MVNRCQELEGGDRIQSLTKPEMADQVLFRGRQVCGLAHQIAMALLHGQGIAKQMGTDLATVNPASRRARAKRARPISARPPVVTSCFPRCLLPE